MKHIEHVEDLVFHEKHGILKTLDILLEVNNYVFNYPHRIDLSLKIDGAPAIVFGHNPDNSQFFISTKSAWNKTPILHYNEESIVNYCKSEDLQRKLITAFRYLPTILPEYNTYVYQGDLMYLKEDLTVNEKGLTFTPNLISYYVPSTDSLYNRILESELGICVHTQYAGNRFIDLTLTDWMGTDDQETFTKALRNSPVYVSLPGIRAYRADTVGEHQSVELAVAEIRKIVTSDEVMFDFFRDKLDVKRQINSFTIDSYIPASLFLVCYRWIQHIKNELLRRLERNLYYQNRMLFPVHCTNGTAHEGFVINYEGARVKFVNREVFSKQNQLYGKFRNARRDPVHI